MSNPQHHEKQSKTEIIGDVPLWDIGFKYKLSFILSTSRQLCPENTPEGK